MPYTVISWLEPSIGAEWVIRIITSPQNSNTYQMAVVYGSFSCLVRDCWFFTDLEKSGTVLWSGIIEEKTKELCPITSTRLLESCSDRFRCTRWPWIIGQLPPTQCNTPVAQVYTVYSGIKSSGYSGPPCILFIHEESHDFIHGYLIYSYWKFILKLKSLSFSKR